MSRHASTEVLARYTGGDLKPRKAARVASHLAGCATCRERVHALDSVPSMLASVQFPPIPANLSSRIEMSIAGESAARVAREPASEAGRRDLPARGGPARHGARVPGWPSSVLPRALAATAAAVVIAAGGYEMATHLGGSTSGQAPGSAALARPATWRPGPIVSYGRSGHTHSIVAVEAATDFLAGTLGKQAAAAMETRHVSSSGVPGAAGAVNSPNASLKKTSPTLQGQAAPEISKLQGCVGLIAAGRNVLLVEIAKYQGKPATIIVTEAHTSGPAEVFAVGATCSSGTRDILASQQVPGL
jgi:hypothetical protein